MAGLGIQLVASLAFVVGLLLVIAKLTARRLGGGSSAPVRVIARQSISRGSGVVVVSVGGRVLVLGATEQQVSLLTEIDPEELGIDVDEPAVDAPDERPAALRPVPAGALAGSVLSARTWRQAMAAVTGHRPEQHEEPQTS